MFKKEVWSLRDIVPSDTFEGAQTFLDSAEKIVKKIESYKKNFKPSISTNDFKKIIDLLEEYSDTVYHVYQYSSLRVSQNSHDQKASAFSAKVNSVCSGHSNRMLWFSLDYVKFPEKDIKRLISAVPKAGYYLKQVVARKNFLLSDKEEKIINIKDVNGAANIITMYNIFTRGFTFRFKGKDVTESELLGYVRDKNPNVRREVYTSLFSVFKKNESLFGEMYRAIASDWYSECVELRGYKKPISVRNTANNVSDKVVEVLMKVIEKNTHVWHKYFRLKAKLLKTKKLSRYDLYAPIGGSDEKISFDQGSRIVLETFKDFSSDMYSCAKQLFEKKHIHSSVVKGKDQGGFCSGHIPNIDPYILLNYVDEPRSVSTLAHELGHAIHFMLASREQSIFHAHSTLPMAETASTFSELLLIEKMKKTNPKMVRSLLFQQIDNAYASIGRQIEFTSFEEKAHELIKNHGSTDDLKKLYFARVKKHFGSSVDVPEIFENEWSIIPHIFDTPFYCYAYGFGNLLALSIYAEYQEKGKGIAEKFIKMLSAGGSMSPAEIVKIVGFDISSEKFWQKGFDALSKMIDELERIE